MFLKAKKPWIWIVTQWSMLEFSTLTIWQLKKYACSFGMQFTLIIRRVQEIGRPRELAKLLFNWHIHIRKQQTLTKHNRSITISKTTSIKLEIERLDTNKYNPPRCRTNTIWGYLQVNPPHSPGFEEKTQVLVPTLDDALSFWSNDM